MRPIMVSLVGEQPIPTLLAVRHFTPAKVVLAFTGEVRSTSERLRKVLKQACEVHPLQVSEFNLDVTESLLDEFITTTQGWEPRDTVFNLTGGTKVMALAAYRLAERWKCPFVYVETGAHRQGEAHRYQFGSDGRLRMASESIPVLIKLQEYFDVHVDKVTFKTGFDPGLGGQFEKAVVEALTPAVNEISHGMQHLGTIDFDVTFRIGNQVGVAELKTSERRQIDLKAAAQLSLRTHREIYGTYTQRFLIVSGAGGVHRDLHSLAEASATTLIELPSFQATGELSSDDRGRLINGVLGVFHRR